MPLKHPAVLYFNITYGTQETVYANISFLLYFQVQCTKPECGKWRQLTKEIQLTSQIAKTYRCGMKLNNSTKVPSTPTNSANDLYVYRQLTFCLDFNICIVFICRICCTAPLHYYLYALCSVAVMQLFIQISPIRDVTYTVSQKQLVVVVCNFR